MFNIRFNAPPLEELEDGVESFYVNAAYLRQLNVVDDNLTKRQVLARARKVPRENAYQFYVTEWHDDELVESLSLLDWAQQYLD